MGLEQNSIAAIIGLGIFLALPLALPFALASEAPPGIPVEFWGSINASDDLNVTVFFDGKDYGQGKTSGGFFSVIVPSDNPLTSLSDPTCASLDPCIPCSTNPDAEDYCAEGPVNGSAVDIRVAGNSTNATVIFDEETAPSQMDISMVIRVLFNLAQGFNLISLPLLLEAPQLSSDPFLQSPQDCIAKAYRYDPIFQTYEVALRDPAFGWGSPQGFTSLDNGRGYWIKSRSPCNASIQGKQAFPRNISLEEGFNLIGWFSSRTAFLNESPIQTNDSSCISKLFRFNPVLSRYDTAQFDSEFGWGSNDGFDRLEPGRGYWLKVSKDCIWNHNP
ncbi:hypothetical protein HYU14_04960 [Candidatus Woesearchaeota archaeon]|nr:hypothetical protein [Candidatus Woesearchaeota archaeon]